MTSLRNDHPLALLLVTLFAAFTAACAGGSLGSPALANLSPEDEAKLATWNQERVSKIGEELATAISEVYKSVNTLQTGAQVGSGQASAFIRLKDRVRVARIESKHLAKQLANGKSRLDTVHSYARLMTVIRDARLDLGKMFIEGATLDKIAVAGDLLRRLSPYYDPQSNERPS